MPLKFNTPTEVYNIGGIQIEVKRDDLHNGDMDLPPWAKLEGVRRTLLSGYFSKNRPIVHLTVRGSYTGWALAYFGKEYGYDVKITYPNTKNYTYDFLRKAEEYGAEAVPIKHNMVTILYGSTRKIAQEKDWQISPNAFDHPVYMDYWYHRSKDFFLEKKYDTLIVQAGSGVTSCGIIKGFLELNEMSIGPMFAPSYGGKKVYIICTSSVRSVQDTLIKYLGSVPDCVNIHKSPYHFYDEIVDHTTPFPCNIYWDKKAWVWMTENANRNWGRSLFWNLGA